MNKESESTFNTVHFGRNPLTCSCERKEDHNVFKFNTFIGCRLSDGAASVAVKGLKATTKKPKQRITGEVHATPCCYNLCPSEAFQNEEGEANVSHTKMVSQK